MPEHVWNLRYAAHLGLASPDGRLLQFGPGQDDVLRQIEHVAEIGFGGIFDSMLKTRPASLQAEMGAALRQFGLAMGTFVNGIETWNLPLWNTPGDAAARARRIDEITESIAAAARVGGRHVTVTTGLLPGVPEAEQRLCMADALAEIAPMAEQAGIILLVEATSSAWVPGLLITSIVHAAELVAAVDSPAVRLLFDVAHVEAMDGEVVRHLDRCWPLIGAIQIADAPGRTDVGTGTLDWAPILGLISRKGWQGLVEIEHYPNTPGPEGEKALLDQLARVDAAIRQGIAGA